MKQAGHPETENTRKVSVAKRPQPTQRRMAARQGRFGELATAINSSPTVQALAQLKESIGQSSRAQALMGVAAEINQDAPAQLRAGAVNGGPALEHGEDVTGAKDAASPATGTASGEVAQLKKRIRDRHDFGTREKPLGTMAVDFEERTRGSSAGMYGTIAFTPAAEAPAAEKIDLVQIASLMTNEKGQQEYELKHGRKKVDEGIKEKDLDTSGDPAIKDMVRTDTYEGFHIDLLFDKSAPRTKSGSAVYESAYNAEKRAGSEEERLDTVRMGKGEDVLNEYRLTEENTTSRKIDQSPGSSDGEGGVKGTEMHDFPVTTQASAFSFQTEINADRQSWGTALWGFTTLMDRLSDSVFVDQVQGPAFQDGRTKEMTEALENFDVVLANPSAWTSPEALEETRALLVSKKKGEHERGCEDLIKMARWLKWVLNRIDNRSRTVGDAEKMLVPHLNTTAAVLGLAQRYKVEDEVLPTLKELYESIQKQLSESG